MTKYQLSHDDMVEHLRDQMSFLRMSADAYDAGSESEAKRLATVIRVLFHDTNNSTSLLTHLGRKAGLRLTDSAEPINPRNLLPTPGLVMMRAQSGVGGSYVPPLDMLAPPRQKPPKPFDNWWTDDVTKAPDGKLYSRKDYVLTTSNKEGGAHVDHRLDSAYNDLARNNAFGMMYEETGAAPMPFERNPALASVRQIAWEVEQTLPVALSDLLN